MIKAAEEVPVDSSQHLNRVGSLAEHLSRKGHNIIWWKSTFHHGNKTYLYDKFTELQPNSNWKIVCLHSKVPYRKNVSFSRIVHYKLLAREFVNNSQNYDVPDLIFCAWPTADFAETAIKYGKKHNIPVVIDIRDLWPDIFERAFPKDFRKIANILLMPIKRKTSGILSKAFSITGVTQDTVRWGCRYAGRIPAKRDKAFFIGSKRINDTDLLRDNVPDEWLEKGIDQNTWNICFLGSLRNSGLDLETVILAVKKLCEKYPDIRLGIAGEGDSRHKLELLADGSEAIVFLGWQNEIGMNTLMSISKVGAYCIENTQDFINTFSNKAIQYTSVGLPILNSLRGFAKDLISERKIGFTYEEKNVDDCMAKIEELYLNEQERKEMAENAIELFNSEFDSEVVNHKIEKYFFKVVEAYKRKNEVR